MYQIVKIICVIGVLGSCIANPAVSKRRTFARQEALPNAAPTGYPAAGFVPDVPFELPSETTANPENSFLPPGANEEPVLVYGAPEGSAQEPVLVYGPPQDSASEPEAVLVYGPPPRDVTDVQNSVDNEEAVEGVVSVSGTFDQPARLRARPAKLQVRRVVPNNNYVYTQTFKRF